MCIHCAQCSEAVLQIRIMECRKQTPDSPTQEFPFLRQNADPTLAAKDDEEEGEETAKFVGYLINDERQ